MREGWEAKNINITAAEADDREFEYIRPRSEGFFSAIRLCSAAIWRFAEVFFFNSPMLCRDLEVRGRLFFCNSPMLCRDLEVRGRFFFFCNSLMLCCDLEVRGKLFFLQFAYALPRSGDSAPAPHRKRVPERGSNPGSPAHVPRMT